MCDIWHFALVHTASRLVPWTKLSTSRQDAQGADSGARPPNELIGAPCAPGDMLASPSCFQGVCEAVFERFTWGIAPTWERGGGHGGTSERGSLGKLPRISGLKISNRSEALASWPGLSCGNLAKETLPPANRRGGQGAKRMNPPPFRLWSGYSSPAALNMGTTTPPLRSVSR